MNLQNEHEGRTSHHTEEPLGMRVHTKISTLERSEGVGTLVVERHRPPYDRRKDLTIIELGRESMRQKICGARGRRATKAAFNLTMTTMDQQEGPLDMLKGQQWLPGLWTTEPRVMRLRLDVGTLNGHVSCSTSGGEREDWREHVVYCVMFQHVPPPSSSSVHCHLHVRATT